MLSLINIIVVINVDISPKVIMMTNDGGVLSSAYLRERKKVKLDLCFDQRLATWTDGAWVGTSFTAGLLTTLPQDVFSMTIG